MAVAGTVAPIFRGKYDSTAIYNFYNVVNHNNIMWICKADGATGIEPNKDNADYWYLAIDGADAASLGGETAEAWQNKLDAIQTTSSGTLSEVGWYRVAEYRASGANSSLMLNGYYANRCYLTIRRLNRGADISESHKILFNPSYGKRYFKELEGNGGVQYATKIRHTIDDANKVSYLEIYNSSTNSASFRFEINEGYDNELLWQAITPTLTAETVEGVTVTCTYDIPSNASPATNLDLVEHEYPYVTGNSESALYNIYDNYSAGMSDNIFYRGRVYHGALHPILGGGYIDLRGFKVYANVEYQKATTSTGIEYFRYKSNGTWTEWVKNATTADFANYLPKSGGTVAGNIEAYSSTDAVDRAINVASPIGNIGLRLSSAEWMSGLYDFKNNRWIIQNHADAPTFNGVASNNLPLDGSKAMTGTLGFGGGHGTLYADSVHVNMLAKNTQSDPTNYRGLLVFTSGSMPDVKNALKLRDMVDNSYTDYKILHTGNSVAVAVTASAPSDTSALWYDTVNKVLKRYVDGAWQQ